MALTLRAVTGAAEGGRVGVDLALPFLTLGEQRLLVLGDIGFEPERDLPVLDRARETPDLDLFLERAVAVASGGADLIFAEDATKNFGQVSLPKPR